MHRVGPLWLACRSSLASCFLAGICLVVGPGPARAFALVRGGVSHKRLKLTFTTPTLAPPCPWRLIIVCVVVVRVVVGITVSMRQ
eukprot:scaffold100339_cov75-Phaeocystis_antarctica.AAC.4